MTDEKDKICKVGHGGQQDWDSKGIVERKIGDFEVQTCYHCKLSRLIKIKYL